jgi:hypothetical protein
MLRAAILVLLSLATPAAAAVEDDAQWPVPVEVAKAVTAGDHVTARRLIEPEVTACVAASPSERKCILVLTTHAAASAGLPELRPRVARAVTAAERNFGPGSVAAAIALGWTAPAMAMAGDPALAEKMLARAILIRTELYGRFDPDVLELREFMPLALGLQGKIKEAVDAAASLIADVSNAPGVTPDHLAIVKIGMAGIAGAYDKERVIAWTTEAVAVLAETRSPTDSALIEAQFKLAELLPDIDTARSIATVALANADQTSLPPAKMARYLLTAARLERNGKEYARSLALLDRAGKLVAGRPELEMLLVGVAKDRTILYVMQERYDLAATAAQEMRAIVEKVMGKNAFFARALTLYEMYIQQQLGDYRDLDRIFDAETIAFWQAVPIADPSRAIAFGILGDTKFKLGQLAAARTWLRYAARASLDVAAARKSFDAKAETELRDQSPVFQMQVQVAWRLSRSAPGTTVSPAP